MTVGQPLVLAEQIADLPGGYPDVPGRHVGVLSDVSMKFDHQGLAEPHHLPVTFIFGIKVGSPFCPSHGKTGQAVFQHLFEAEEFENTLVYGGVEPQTALVGTNGVVKLNPPRPVHADIPLVILPADPEDDNAVGLGHPFEDVVFEVLRMVHHVWHEGNHHFVNRLMKFLLVGVPALQAGHEVFDSFLCLLVHIRILIASSPEIVSSTNVPAG